MLDKFFADDENYESIVSKSNLLDFSSVKKYGFEYANKLYIPNNEFIKFDKLLPCINFENTNSELAKLVKHIKNHSQFRRIPISSKFHSNNIKISKFYENIEDVYRRYIFILFEKFKRTQNFENFFNFDTFVIKFIYELYADFLFMSDFIESEGISIFSSGLAVKLFDEKETSKDVAKEYIQDKYFHIFKNICLQYNFIIDRNMPWVIVYRVGNEYFKNNLDKYTNVYANDMNILYMVLKQVYIYYVDNVLNKDYFNLVNLSDFSLPRDTILNLYLKKKLEKNKISYSNEDFITFKRFFKANTVANGLDDSASKLDKLKQENNTFYDDWEQIYFRSWNN